MVAAALGLELIRLQCYEGLDEAKALYEWEYAKQLLYTQILKDKIGEVLGGAAARCTRRSSASPREDDVFFSDRFILPRPLLRAITSEQPVVLLIDEIDKSDAEFEAFLLEVLTRLPGERARARHAERHAHPDRRAHQQQRPRDVGRAQAPLPASLHRLPGPASRSSRSCG